MEFFNVTPNPIYGIHNPIYGIPNPIYGIHNPVGLKYLTRLLVGLSHLSAHKHQYNFSDTSSKYCSCRDNLPETVEHYLLHCPIYSLLRRELFGKLRLVVSLLTLTSSAYTCNLLSYGNPCFRMVTLATTFIPIKKFLNLQLALLFRVKDLMVLLFPMTNDLIFCVECITLVCLFTFFFFILRGRGGGRFCLDPSSSLYLEGPKVGLGRVSLCIYVCFLCNSCYIYVV